MPIDVKRIVPPRRALILLGPTGSGKTPLGQWIERHGLWGPAWAHFDFGDALRRVARREPDASFSADDLSLVRRVLISGALLEDSGFPLAARILAEFIDRAAAAEDRGIVLNGLPRHIGQAQALDAMVLVCGVVHLQSSEAAILERIRRDVGGDRVGRVDDRPDDVRRKLAIYRERTAPLLNYYRQRHVTIHEIPVAASMEPKAVWRTLAARNGE